MLSWAFDRRQRVLRLTVSGIYGSDDMEELDRQLIEFIARYGEARAIFDFTEVEAFALPESRLVQRAQQPAIVRERVLVASRILQGEGARTYARHQREAGGKEAVIVSSLDEAYAVLDLKNPRFEPVES
jgi:hypothetical protein